MNLHFDWQGVLTGQPLQWLLNGYVTTLWVSLIGALLATLLAIFLLLMRLSGNRLAGGFVEVWVSLLRNTPILVQFLFWYFSAWNLLPRYWRDWINADHPGALLPGNVNWLAPEFLCSAWGLALFISAFMVEELSAGLSAVPKGQREAALSQGFSTATALRWILLPQGLVNAWQPITGQYLNLMKLSSLASGIGFAELTYQVRQVDSYNAHALEAFAIGTLLYLITGVLLGFTLSWLGPRRRVSGWQQ